MKPSICIFGCGQHADRVLSEKDQSAEFNLYFASRDRDRAKSYSDKYKGIDLNSKDDLKILKLAFRTFN